MIKEIIFDCFGVLTEDGWLAFLRRYDDGTHSEELRYINHQFDRGILTYRDFLKEACGLTNVEESVVDAMIAGSYQANELLFEYIRELKERGFSLGVISNAGTDLQSFLPDIDLSVFDHITISYEVGAIKPDPLIYQAHLDKTGFRPQETIFVDDREVNLEGAATLGISTVLYKDFVNTKKAVEDIIKG